MAVLLPSKPISKYAVRLAVEVINTRLKTLEQFKLNMNWCWMRKSLLSRKAFRSSCASSGNDSKKDSGKVEGPVSTITLPSKDSVNESLSWTEIVKVCCGKRPVEIHFPFDIGSIRSYVSGCFVRCCDPSFQRSENVSCEVFDTSIASKSKCRNLYN